MDTKVALVTGGAGFIGSALCDALIAKGLRVICVDNLLTGSEENLNEAKKNPLFRFVRHDVCVPGLDVGAVDYIFHLASPASVIDYQNLPEETALANSAGTIQMLAYAQKYKARFVFASTSEIYGDPSVHPQTEQYWGNVNPNGIRSCYDESKRFGEAITMVYVRKYGVDCRIVRIFNTYGPRMRKTDGRVVSNFIVQALANKPITVYGDGSQTRSFCFVSDLVNGLMKLMFTDNLNGEVVNLGNPEEFTMVELARKVQEMTKTKSEIAFEALPVDDPKKRRPDISKAKRLLSWEIRVSVDEGLRETIEYYKHVKSNS